MSSPNATVRPDVDHSGWMILPCSALVLLQQGRPVRVSDGGHDFVTEEQIVYDLAVLGWTVSVGEWSVGDERDATAAVKVKL